MVVALKLTWQDISCIREAMARAGFYGEVELWDALSLVMVRWGEAPITVDFQQRYAQQVFRKKVEEVSD